MRGVLGAKESPGSSPPNSTEAGEILAVRYLRRVFGGLAAVDGADFGLQQGRITGLIGPNGAGKSTAINLISGLLAPSQGEILLDGRDIAGWAPERISQAGMVRTFQLSSEFPRLTVMENLLVAVPDRRGNSVAGALLGKRYWQRDQQDLVERAEELLDRFGLSGQADSYAGELSGGQKRLLEIMRALMKRPRVLLLDEPFAGVNPTLSIEVQSHLLALRNEGMTMLLVEHELESVERLCDLVIVMAQGKVLASGSMAELRRNPEVIDAYLTG